VFETQHSRSDKKFFKTTTNSEKSSPPSQKKAHTKPLKKHDLASESDRKPDDSIDSVPQCEISLKQSEEVKVFTSSEVDSSMN